MSLSSSLAVLSSVFTLTTLLLIKSGQLKMLILPSSYLILVSESLMPNWLSAGSIQIFKATQFAHINITILLWISWPQLIQCEAQRIAGIRLASTKIGDQVGFTAGDGDELFGIVTKLNPKRAKIQTGQGIWAVPYSMLFTVINSDHSQDQVVPSGLELFTDHSIHPAPDDVNITR